MKMATKMMIVINNSTRIGEPYDNPNILLNNIILVGGGAGGAGGTNLSPLNPVYSGGGGGSGGILNYQLPNPFVPTGNNALNITIGQGGSGGLGQSSSGGPFPGLAGGQTTVLINTHTDPSPFVDGAPQTPTNSNGIATPVGGDGAPVSSPFMSYSYGGGGGVSNDGDINMGGSGFGPIGSNLNGYPSSNDGDGGNGGNYGNYSNPQNTAICGGGNAGGGGGGYMLGTITDYTSCGGVTPSLVGQTGSNGNVSINGAGGLSLYGAGGGGGAANSKVGLPGGNGGNGANGVVILIGISSSS